MAMAGGGNLRELAVAVAGIDGKFRELAVALPGIYGNGGGVGGGVPGNNGNSSRGDEGWGLSRGDEVSLSVFDEG